MEKSFTTKDPARLAPQPKQNKTFHRRDAEFAEFGVYLYQTDFYSASSAPPRWAFRKIAQAEQIITDSITKSTKFMKIRTLRGLRDLRGESVFSSWFRLRYASAVIGFLLT